MPIFDAGLLSMIGLGGAMGFLFLWLLGTVLPDRTSADEPGGDPLSHRMIFVEKELVFATRRISEAIEIDDPEANPYAILIERLTMLFPGFDKLSSGLETMLGDIELTERTTTGELRLRVARDEDRLIFDIIGIADPLSRNALVPHDRFQRDQRELRSLRNIVRAAPFAIWQENAMGEIDYTNACYGRISAMLPGDAPADHLFPTAPVTELGKAPVTRRTRLENVPSDRAWYEVASFAAGESCVHFATGISATIRAEEGLRQFTQTLTQTFASLPIGLAIFDRARQLVVFNPALVELTSLDPSWLSARPTLRDLLDRLREARMVPERKDFSDWRSRMEHLEESATKGTYCETWTLPSGQTYRVTGRPHPEGALAFVFEDISAEISLTRKFRQELELSRSLFDSLTEAIAVFQPNGELVMANDAFAALWQIDPDQTLGQTTIIDATATWQTRCKPTPVWGDLRDFIATKSERSEWFAQVEMKSGAALDIRFVPLSGGLTLVGFLDAGAPAQTIAPSEQAALVAE